MGIVSGCKKPICKQVVVKFMLNYAFAWKIRSITAKKRKICAFSSYGSHIFGSLSIVEVRKNIKLRQRVQIKNPLIIFDEKKCGEYGYGIF